MRATAFVLLLLGGCVTAGSDNPHNGGPADPSGPVGHSAQLRALALDETGPVSPHATAADFGGPHQGPGAQGPGTHRAAPRRHDHSAQQHPDPVEHDGADGEGAGHGGGGHDH